MTLPPLPDKITPVLTYWNEEDEIIAITRDLTHVMFFRLKATEKEWEPLKHHNLVKLT